MRVAIAHQVVPEDAPPDVADVLDQVRAVQDALRALGHEVSIVPVNGDLTSLELGLIRMRPDVVVNLVEELDGQGRLASRVPALLEGRGVRFTGSSGPVLGLADDKLAAKAKLLTLGLPTAPWWAVGGPWRPTPYAGPVIVKSVYEHGSLGIDDDAVVTLPDAALDDLLQTRSSALGGAAFAEAYLHGREFNVSILEVDGRIRCLPAAEIEFLGLPEGAPHLVGYQAKWSPNSEADLATPRKQTFEAADQALLDRLQELAHQAFEGFGLSGYGRVDFRVDAAAQPFILEVNANPCLAPGAGFEAALVAAGISYSEAVGHLLARALAE